MGYLLKKVANRDWASPRERTVLQSAKIKRIGDLKSTLTSDMEMQSLEFSQLVFGLALVQYFLTMTFWNGTVYPVMWEVRDLLFDFIEDYS